jgi:hypothetical protein
MKRMGTLPWRAGLLVLVLATITMAAPVASAQDRPGDRPHGVAKVRLEKKFLLQADGAIIVAARLECDPGWQSSDLSVSVAQGDSSTDGFTTTAVPCDRNWHRVKLSLPPGTGAFQPGKATASAQFLVTNVLSGDSAGAHQNQVSVSMIAAAAT